MFTFGLATSPRGFDPLVLLFLALAIEAGVGEARWLFRFVRHPIVLVGNLVTFLDRKLNREKRSEWDRALRGAFAALFVVALVGAIGWGVAWLTQNHTFGWIVELFLLVTLSAQRGLYDHVRAVGRALDGEGVEAGRRAVAHIVGRDPQQLDEHGVARAALESLAENFGDAVVAPVFWYVLFGMPGLLIYKAANTMDSMIGHLTPQYRAFGMAAARFDDALNFIPARLAGILISLAALFAPKANPWGAFTTMVRDAGKHRSINAGWPEGAMAGALGLALAGPRRYSQHVVNDPWVGQGRARATALDIRRGLYVYAVACLINALMVATLAVTRLGFA